MFAFLAGDDAPVYLVRMIFFVDVREFFNRTVSPIFLLMGP